MKRQRRMPSPEAEARRLAAVRAAVARVKPWSWSTGPTTTAGKRRMAMNPTKHEAGSVAFKLALTYVKAVESALSGYLAFVEEEFLDPARVSIRAG